MILGDIRTLSHKEKLMKYLFFHLHDIPETDEEIKCLIQALPNEIHKINGG